MTERLLRHGPRRVSWVLTSIAFGVYATDGRSYTSELGHLASVVRAAPVPLAVGERVPGAASSWTPPCASGPAGLLVVAGAGGDRRPTRPRRSRSAAGPAASSSSAAGASAAARAATLVSCASRSSRRRGACWSGGGGVGWPGLILMMRKRSRPSMIRRRWFSRSSSGVVALELVEPVVGLGAVVDLVRHPALAPVVARDELTAGVDHRLGLRDHGVAPLLGSGRVDQQHEVVEAGHATGHDSESGANRQRRRAFTGHGAAAGAVEERRAGWRRCSPRAVLIADAGPRACGRRPADRRRPRREPALRRLAARCVTSRAWSVRRPRERRALNGGDAGGKRGARSVMHRGGAESTEAPRDARPTPPSPQSGGAGQPAAPERSAPAPPAARPRAPPPRTGEFTPDPAP